MYVCMYVYVCVYRHSNNLAHIPLDASFLCVQKPDASRASSGESKRDHRDLEHDIESTKTGACTCSPGSHVSCSCLRRDAAKVAGRARD